MVSLVVCQKLHTSNLININMGGEVLKMFVVALIIEVDGAAIRFREPTPVFIREFSHLYMTAAKFKIEHDLCDSCKWRGLREEIQGLDEVGDPNE